MKRVCLKFGSIPSTIAHVFAAWIHFSRHNIASNIPDRAGTPPPHIDHPPSCVRNVAADPGENWRMHECSIFGSKNQKPRGQQHQSDNSTIFCPFQWPQPCPSHPRGSTTFDNQCTMYLPRCKLKVAIRYFECLRLKRYYNRPFHPSSGEKKKDHRSPKWSGPQTSAGEYATTEPNIIRTI